ncbi:hypothetical protein GLOIN_2v1655004 [Rhizophagus clarus]|uniref:Uncharacterized protein n=1 Tax=Rhizophagus clarus TaxID=94130 RepID=A0A8H3LPK5_9GLOM|nr:hypothetical protein GLOIN_2v1655004 [Rhizophagus clarus]
MGCDFLKTSKEEFLSYRLLGGPAKRLADFAKKCKEKKKRAFSSYRSLEEVLEKYGTRNNNPHPIDESSKEFKLCIDDILRRDKKYGPVVDSNETIRREYISTILHTAVSGLVILPQMNVSGEESSGRVDYAIKKILDDLLGEIICITEGKQTSWEKMWHKI